VMCIAPAVMLLVNAQGKLAPDPVARKMADDAEEKIKPAHACVSSAERLRGEIDVFRASAKAAHLDTNEDETKDTKKPKKQSLGGRLNRKIAEKEKEPDVTLAWTSAQPSQKAAKLLAVCRLNVEATTGGPKADVTPAWDAIAQAADLKPATADKKEELNAARTLLKLFDNIPVDKIIAATQAAEDAAKVASTELAAKADKAQIREPLPEGLIPRRLAVGIGVGLSVIALLLSYLSVRVSSNRRLMTLIPLREAAKTTQPGLHAAAVLRLASQPNGGLPGAVIGGALGGLVAAGVAASDTDVFIGGVMTGFLFGLGVQFLYRVIVGAARWRVRATELAEIEKPAIPIVLVLSGVNPGLEAPFIKFFTGLSEPDAAGTVEKLAAQAEERILAAADAGAAARQQAAPPGMPGQ
jgi:hypothetical protein